MRLHRFIGNFTFTTDVLEISDPEILNQWKNVLRLSKDDKLILCDGAGTEAEGIILELHKKGAKVALEKPYAISRGPIKEVHLHISILRRDNLELVAQKATEIGVTHIHPMITERTVKTGLNTERLEKIIKEATEQSGRTNLPVLSETITLEEALQIDGQKVFFHLDGTPAEEVAFSNPTHIYIGPEGGFSDTEVTLAKESGATIASFGELTYRAETAAIVASYAATKQP